MNHSDRPIESHSDDARFSFAERALRYQDGTLTPEEMIAFSAELSGNPQRQQEFIEIQFRSAVVREIMRRQAYEVAEDAASPLPDECHRAGDISRTPDLFRSRRQMRRVGLATACGVLLACGAMILLSRVPREQGRQRPLPQEVAVIPADVLVAGVSRAKFFGGGSLEAGRVLQQLRDYMLLEGLVKLAFPNGATAIIEGPAMFRVINPECLALDTGSCSIHAPEGAEGFRVLTPMTEVVDRGTRFSVKVDETTQTEVHVIEGAADLIAATQRQLMPGSQSVQKSDPAPDEIRLTERQAVRFSGFGTERQQPTSFNPNGYRRQLPDRIVDYQAHQQENGTVDELRGVTVQRGGRLINYSAEELIPIEVTWFRSEERSDPNGHLLGGAVPPEPRKYWLEDRRLDTGVINFGGGASPLVKDPVMKVLPGDDSGTPGLGIRFRSPVVNHPGPDVVFFEIQCFTNPLEGDPFHVSPVHFRPGLKTLTVRNYDLMMISPESREVPPFWLYRYSKPVHTLEELSRQEIEPNGGVMRLHFRALAVGIDLSDLGYADDERVEELFFQHATAGDASRVDPVLIAGLPELSKAELEEIR